MRIEIIERIGRVAAVLVGAVLLSLMVVGRASWWALVGVVPLAMGLSGW